MTSTTLARTALANSTARRSRGFTLIDLMIVLTIVGILLGQAAPSWMRAFDDQKLRGEAQSVATALQVARSEAVARSQAVSLSILSTPSGATCHLAHTGSANDCRCADDGRASCSAAGTVVTSGVHDPAVHATLSRSIRFDPRSGTATPTGTVVVRSARGHEIQHRVAITGRVHTCAATEGLHGLSPCAR
jgi:type IV fimbrial biogenesis protein FimT